MRILVLGAAGFIGKNLISSILKTSEDEMLLYDLKDDVYPNIIDGGYSERYKAIKGDFSKEEDFLSITEDIDIVYHLISTTLPNTPMDLVSKGIVDNVVVTSKLLDACVKNKVKKIVFVSSGGTVYGIGNDIPYKEDSMTNPISAYGLQKLSIEKMLYLYNYTYGLDYSIVRLANPYGPHQNPNGVQGVVTTFTYNAMMDKELCVYGDGNVIRDYIYIDDAIEAIKKIALYEGKYKIFNVGSGIGTSINDVICIIQRVFKEDVKVRYIDGRKADVPISVLDISRYEDIFGRLVYTDLYEGICNLKLFFESQK